MSERAHAAELFHQRLAQLCAQHPVPLRVHGAPPDGALAQRFRAAGLTVEAGAAWIDVSL